jgi:alkanesulfonate monooxygenase SsuD/methylene tetrahydromethanopterin reductase-like flavin-dependent oxidoreductase (luciferase family)
MTRSAMVGVLVGRDAAEVKRREKALLTALDVEAGEEWFEERRTRWIMGTPDEARATVARFEAGGVQRMMLQDFVPRDLEMIELLGRELIAKG